MNFSSLNPKAIKKLLQIFNSEERTKFIWLFLAILIMGFLEVMGVASILPFMQLIAEPNAIEQSSWLSRIYTYFQFEDTRSMLIYFGVGIIILIGVTNIFSIFTLWLQYKYSWDIAHGIGIRLLSTYLDKPYSYFLQTNTSELQTYIVSEVNILVGGVIIPMIELISRTFVSLVIFGLLLMVDPMISLVMFGGLGGAYILVYMSRQGFLKRIGMHRIAMNVLRYKSLGELLSGIKTVMVYNEQAFFYDRYKESSKEFCDVQPRYNLILAAPKYMLEFLAFGSILVVTIYLFISSGNIQSALPRLTLYAVAGYRLLPALQKAFAAAAKYKHNYPVLEKLYDDLLMGVEQEKTLNTSREILPFHDSITLKNVEFSYEESDHHVLKKLNLTIPKGKTIAFIGSTGSGKTTLVDLIVGLLKPVSGSVEIDYQKLNADNTRLWQNNIAYVPQEVFLFDDTILQNIVLGNKGEAVDMEHLIEVCQNADIYNFISNELPDGFNTKIGERGVRLSGGQRQRLGLARALYRNPNVLVLDEATSALDSITEKGIIESLRILPNKITTIIIAHRLSTVRDADCIYFLKEGVIHARGDYNALMHSNETFKTMVELS